MASPHLSSSASVGVAAPVFEEFHTSNVQSYGEQPRDSMRTIHVSYSYLTEEPHMTLEFAASDATKLGPRTSIHLRAIKGSNPWKFSMEDIMAAKAHVSNRLSMLKLGQMVDALYKIKQKDAEKQCALAIARASATVRNEQEIVESKAHAKTVQTGGIFG